MKKPLLSLFVGYLFVAATLQAQSTSIWNFNYTGSIVSWTVPQDGLYQITAYGAQGGYNGGLGASMGGVINLSAGEVLDILVGQQGQGASNQVLFGGGGGGGSFVVGSNNTPLIIAGAGGGGGHGDQYGKDYPLADGYASTNTSGGNTGYYTQPTSKKPSLFVTTAYGGTDGGGGNISTDSAAGGSEQGAGGGGFSGDGASVTSGIGGKDVHAAGGSSYLNGGAGGSGGTVNNGQAGNSGGFGGGGQGSSYGAGGGGGYSGGASGPQLATEGGSPTPGGGGGSYLASSAAHAVMSVGNTGSGLVVISYDLNLIVGNNASNQSTNFTEGNNVYDGIYVGSAFGDSNNSISVANVGTFLDAYNNAIVGENGSANSLTVSNGGSVMNGGAGIIGLNATAEGNSVMVTGTYSSWSIGTALLIGNSGSANSLAIQAGGQVLAGGAGAVLGYNAGSSNNSLIIDGSASTLGSSADLIVGLSGNSNTVAISNGGSMMNGQVSYGGVIGLNAGANNNRVAVTGTGSSWSNSGNLTIGWNGASNIMSVVSGGQVVSAQGIVGDVSSNNSALVTGSGSIWSNSGDLIIGASGASNSMVVSNGATVTNGQVNYGGVIGLNAGANNNSVLVTGSSGSAWNNVGNLTIGYDGSDNSMVVSGGAFVVNGMTDIQGVLLTNGGTGVIGLNSASSNNGVLVTGTGSTWIDGGDLFVGSSASGNSLVISNGGTVMNWSVAYGGVIGFNVGSSNNRVLVSGTGSTWNVKGNLMIGDAGSGNLAVANGGSAVASAIMVASAGGSSGALNIGSLGGSDTAGTIDSPTIAFGAGSGTINFNQVDTSTMTSAISGNGFINQLGSGTTILSGSNNFSGTTTVKAGLLLANSSNALGSSMMLVTNSGTLGGNGTIGGVTTIASGGTLNPGSDGVGALSFRNALTLAAGSTTSFQIHSTNDFTSINLIGTSLAYGGTLVFNLINFTPVAGNEFSVFNMIGGSTESGNFERIEVGTSYLNYAAGLWSGVNDGVTYQFNDATGKLTVQAIPEPSTWALLGLGALGMLIALRRRGLA